MLDRGYYNVTTIMPIPVVPLKQSTKNDCALTSLQMILHYYGDHSSPEEINDFLLKDNEGGSFLTELGRFAKHKGFTVNCYAYNLYFTSPEDARLSPFALLMKLKTEQNKPYFDEWHRELIESTILSVAQGVHYIIQKPHLEMIRDYLHRGIPLIATVTSAALYHRQADPFVGHDIVLTGIENDTISFIDPDDGQEHQTTQKNFMFALLSRKIIAASACVLALMK